MAAREILNRVKIEGWRLSKVPIDPTEVVYQGDLMAWDGSGKVATKAVSGASCAFVGMAETTNPIETIGSTRFLSDTQSARINVVQQGLVELVVYEAATYYPFDLVTVADDPQSIIKSGADASNQIGFVDPAVGASGAVKAKGDTIKVWLTVRDAYKAFA